MMELPGWLNEFRDRSRCPNCSHKLSKKGVFGLGIREEIHKGKKVTSFCFEYLCPSCDNRSVFTGFPITFEQFIESIADLAKPVDNIESYETDSEDIQEEVKPQKKKKAGITDNEMKKFSKELKDIQSHEEFLEKLGINIQEYKKRKNENQ